jgi:hypothetical protein
LMLVFQSDDTELARLSLLLANLTTKPQVY